MDRDIAIIGMACMFPKAPDLGSYWRNIRDGVDAITEVPADRWDPAYYDPTSNAPDRLYTRRGGFVDDYARFDPAKFGIMPAVVKETEPEQLLTLQIAADALEDAGYAKRDFARERTSVVIGRGNYAGPRMVHMVDVTRGALHLMESLQRLVPGITTDQLAAIKKDFQSKCGPFGPDTAMGLIPNLLASRIANRLDLKGSAQTIDAACASALIALDTACRELREGGADLSLVGGVHLCHDVAFWSVFSQLGALSRKHQIRPFDRHADGLLIGEGIGMFVLKRLADAQRADDRIYAVIRGIGTSSDGRDSGLMAPHVEGQVLAVGRAWRDAGLDPETIGLVEAHGTATAIGDAAELGTLARVFGTSQPGRERIPVGSVKSMIGHTMPAAGAAGLMKAVLAVHHGMLPPTLHVDEPHPLLERTRFRTLRASEPWEGNVRRAGVNAFGFGGINAHVIIDAPVVRGTTARATTFTPDPAEEALLIAAASQAELVSALHARRGGGEGPWRLALFSPTPDRIAKAAAAIAAGRPRHGRDGIYFSPRGLLADGGKIAFVYPGVEARDTAQVDDVARKFGLPIQDRSAPDLGNKGVGISELSILLSEVARRVGLTPDMYAGHSIGEWSAMVEAGVFEEASLRNFFEVLDPQMLRVVNLSYVAAGAGADRIAAMIEDLPDVVVSHDNCVHQSIVCGQEEGIARLLPRLREARIVHEVLPFQSGFHSPALAGHVDHYVKLLGTLQIRPPKLPLWSATTCAPYPDDPEGITALYVDHLLKPVRFRELTLAMYEAGARVFVQVGSGSLAAFVDDSLAGRPHLAVSLAATQRGGMEQLRRAFAALYVEGAQFDLAELGLAAPVGASATPVRATLPLALGARLVRIEARALPVVTPMSALAGSVANDPVHAAFETALQEIASAQQSVMRAFAAPRAPATAPLARAPEPPQERSDRIELSLARYPELIDHSLIPQPADWPHDIDRSPAVPMTMSVELLREGAQRLDPHRVPVAVENVLASSWLYVEPATTVTVSSRRIAPDKIHVKIEGYVEGTVTMADRYADSPLPSAEPLVDPQPYPHPLAQMYENGYFFHGPRYRGVRDLRDVGPTGMRGTIEALPAKGAILDCAGQIFGAWIVARVEVDQMAFPVRLGHVQYYGDAPPAGAIVECTVWLRSVRRREVRGDVELVHDGRVWLRVTNWEDWRFESDDAMYAVTRMPSKHLLATFDEQGCAMLTDRGWRKSTLDILMRRFLSTREVEEFGGSKRMYRQRDWLCGRVAAKDAVRRLIRETEKRELWPIEVGIVSDELGRPVATVPSGADVRISIAHKDAIGYAAAAIGVDPGVDIEKIEARSDDFAKIAFSPEELALLPGGDRDEWITRFWCAKEAAGKAARTGLAGNPRGVPITAVQGERIEAGGRWIVTRRMDQYIVASTTQ